MASKEFADRLREKMRERDLTQQKMADALYVSRQTVTRWLGATIPIARHLSKLAALLDASPQWLLTGNDNARGMFQGRFLDHMAHSFELLRELGSESAKFDPAVEAYEEILRDSNLRAAMATEKLRELSSQWHQRVAKIQNALQKKALQISDMPLDPEPMAMPTVNQLLDRVREITKAPGAKVEFARAIGVRPQHLSAWLAGRYHPSGETVLKMLARVQALAPKLNQNLPEDAVTPSGRRKTPLRRSSHHEKSKSAKQKKSPSRSKKPGRKRD